MEGIKKRSCQGTFGEAGGWISSLTSKGIPEDFDKPSLEEFLIYKRRIYKNDFERFSSLIGDITEGILYFRFSEGFAGWIFERIRASFNEIISWDFSEEIHGGMLTHCFQ